MKTNRFSRHGLVWVVGGLVLAGFVFSMTHDSPAKDKKVDPKTKTKEKDKDTPKKEAKAKPVPETLPARIDIADTTHGTGEAVRLIDKEISTAWKKNSVYPSDRCTDDEFLRRVSIDIIGRIPTVEERQAFLAQKDYSRRAWVINAMLDGAKVKLNGRDVELYDGGSEYAQNFANLWTVHLMTRSGSAKGYQQQMNDWLYDQFKNGNKGSPNWSETAYQLIAGEGATNANPAVNYLLHNLGEEIKQDPKKNGKWDMVPATSRTTRLFLGIRTQCVQCHDHPFNGEWRQEHFWGINAFLRQYETTGRPTMMANKKKKDKADKGDIQQYKIKDVASYNESKLIGFERRNAVVFFTDPSFLDGTKIPDEWKGTRREFLGKQVLASPYFAKAFINRTWGHFFGISFTRGPVDDFHQQNEPSHPALLDTLSKDWAEKYNYNPKVLIRWVCNSQAYGLSSRANEWNDKTDDESLFARMLLKPMSPEVMYASVTVATNYNWHAFSKEKKQAKLDGGETWYSQLVTNFGNDEGEEGTYSGTVIQALLMMNGQETNKALTDKETGTVAYVEKKHGASMLSLPRAIDDMYLHALGRLPTALEKKNMMSPDRFNFRPGSKTTPATPQFWSHYYEDIMWALLNSNEFILNH
jgi:hypothetical protein